MKELFFEKTPPSLKEKFSQEQHSILDEAIENIINGSSTINGKFPQTDQEAFILIAYGFLTGSEVFEGLKIFMRNQIIEGNKETTLDIKYRGEKYSYSYNNKEDVEKEIQNLKKYRDQCRVQVNDKKDARDFFHDIKTFTDNLEKTYKHIRYNVPETDQRSIARYNFNKGLKSLKIYFESRLKQKHDHYFFEGKEYIISGIGDLIIQLEKKLES